MRPLGPQIIQEVTNIFGPRGFARVIEAYYGGVRNLHRHRSGATACANRQDHGRGEHNRPKAGRLHRVARQVSEQAIWELPKCSTVSEERRLEHEHILESVSRVWRARAMYQVTAGWCVWSVRWLVVCGVRRGVRCTVYVWRVVCAGVLHCAACGVWWRGGAVLCVQCTPLVANKKPVG